MSVFFPIIDVLKPLLFKLTVNKYHKTTFANVCIKTILCLVVILIIFNKIYVTSIVTDPKVRYVWKI